MCCGAERQRQHPPGPGGIRELTGASLGPCADFWSMLSCSVILWLGDLNYRLEELDVTKVKQLVDERAFPELCQYDQVWMPHPPAGGAEGAN